MPFDAAQGGEPVEPFVICDLVLGIFTVKRRSYVLIAR